MIKLTFCLHRLPGMSREAFQEYWFNIHAPLVARHSATLRIKRYVQMHSTSDPLNDVIGTSRRAPAMYDGVAELWWDSLEDLRAPATPERVAAAQDLLEDERRFIDLARSPLFLGYEKAIIG
ncbi:MAG: EthD domain-containing protein [Alphaproteobacteria bacterium]|nr:EthD domain-containing protein [Alphaproteobacteria bacterium]